MIAREGLILILIAVMASVILILAAVRWDNRFLAVLAGLFAVLTMFTVFFFRDPPRQTEPQPGILVSSADGTVLAIDTLPHFEYVGGETIKISIFMSVFDVHVNRVPVTGRVEKVDYFPGEFNVAYRDKASKLNERSEIGIISESGHRVLFKQIAGLLARRVIYYLKPEQDVTVGERYGIIRFGSRAELFVPVGSDIKIAVGDHVKGGETVIGFLPEAISPTEGEFRD